MASVADAVTLMRHRAELVVRYEPYPGNPMGSLKWVGVFKPVADLDPVFAAAEPPAHDSWTHVDVLDKRTKSVVIVTLRGIRDEVRRFLTPRDLTPDSENLSTGALSSALAGLAGGLTGVTASPGTSRRSRRGKGNGPRARAVVRSIEPLPRDADDVAQGRQRTAIILTVEGPQTDWLVRLESLSLAVDGGTMRSENEVRLDRWSGGRAQADGVIVRPLEEVSAVVSYPAGMAISFDIGVEVP